MRRNREEFSRTDLREAFFDVAERPLMVNYNGRLERVSKYRAITDAMSKKLLSIVSDKYNVVTNEDAYNWADYIIQGVFPGSTLKDFEVYNVRMPQTKGSCIIDLIIPHSERTPFGGEDKWVPFVRIINSYNKVYQLRYEVGFCRSICLNGVIFDEMGITLAFPHTEIVTPQRLMRLIYQSRKEIGEIEDLWVKFHNKMEVLRSLEISKDYLFPMFCKAFSIKLDPDKLSAEQIFNQTLRARRIQTLAEDYYGEMDNSAYALFNVLTDYASFPEEGIISMRTNGYQHKVGQWLDALITAQKDKNFSLDSFIDEDSRRSANYLQSLISKAA